MRIRTVVGALVGVFMMLISATPAAAQGGKVDVAAGYQSLTFLEGGSFTIPMGWGFSAAAGKDWVKFVGDFGGHYKDGVALHTFQGGVEFSGKAKRVVPYVRVLSGLGYFTDWSEGMSAFVFTPEGGVKIMGNDRVGAQISAGFPIMHDSGSTETTFRLFVGIVYRK